MFCSNCGKNLPDDVKFCDGCGAQIGAAPASAAPASAVPAPNPMIQNFLKVLKGIFSKNTVKTVGEAAQSHGSEWILLALISWLTYTFALCTNVYSSIYQVFNSLINTAMKATGEMGGMLGMGDYVKTAIKTAVGQIYNFGSCFLYGLLISVGVYFLMSFAIFAMMKVVFKKNIGLINVFNLVSAASLPLGAIWLLNLVLGLLWMPLVSILSVVGFVAFAILLYVGIQKLAKLETSPFLAYVGTWGVVAAIVVIVVCLVAGSTLGNAMNMLENLGNMF